MQFANDRFQVQRNNKILLSLRASGRSSFVPIAEHGQSLHHQACLGDGTELGLNEVLS